MWLKSVGDGCAMEEKERKTAVEVKGRLDTDGEWRRQHEPNINVGEILMQKISSII